MTRDSLDRDVREKQRETKRRNRPPLFSEDPAEYLWNQGREAVLAWLDARHIVMGSPSLRERLDRNPDTFPSVIAIAQSCRLAGRTPEGVPILPAIELPDSSPLELPPPMTIPTDLPSYLRQYPSLAAVFEKERAFLSVHPELLEAMQQDLSLARAVLRCPEGFRRLAAEPGSLRYLLGQSTILKSVLATPWLLVGMDDLSVTTLREENTAARRVDRLRNAFDPSDDHYHTLGLSPNPMMIRAQLLPPLLEMLRRLVLLPLRMVFYVLLWLLRALVLRLHLFNFRRVSIFRPSGLRVPLYRFVLRQRPRVLVCMPFNVHPSNVAYRCLVEPLIRKRLGGRCFRISHVVDGDWRAYLRKYMLCAHIVVVDVSHHNRNVSEEREYLRALNHNCSSGPREVLIACAEDQVSNAVRDEEDIVWYNHAFLPLNVKEIQERIESALVSQGFRRGFFDPWVLYPDRSSRFKTMEDCVTFERSWMATRLREMTGLAVE